MSGIKIRGTGSCLPGRVLTNSELARRVDTTDEWITTRTGIRERPGRPTAACVPPPPAPP